MVDLQTPLVSLINSHTMPGSLYCVRGVWRPLGSIQNHKTDKTNQKQRINQIKYISAMCCKCVGILDLCLAHVKYFCVVFLFNLLYNSL